MKLLLLALLFVLCGFAVSGQESVNSGIVVDIGSLKYVFATDIRSFISQLNVAGKTGYRLEQLTKLPLNNSERFEKMKLAGIMKLDPGNRFEYDWFEAFTPGEVVTRMDVRSAMGFNFRDALPVLQGICEDNSEYQQEDGSDAQKVLDRVRGTLEWSSGAIYFVERKNDEVKSNNYRVVIGMLGWGKNPGEELESGLSDLDKAGFIPVSMNSFKIRNKYAFAVLAKRKTALLSEGVSQNKSDFRLIVLRSGFEKKVNLLAKDGYSLLFSGRLGALNYALMVRSVGPYSSASYTFLTSTHKAFSSALSAAPAKHLIYSGLGNDDYGCDSAEVGLVFKTADRQRAIYETLKMTSLPKNSKETGPPTTFQRPTDETIGRFEQLLKEGYAVRELYFDNDIEILFEKR